MRELEELAELLERDPDAVMQVLDENPELRAELLEWAREQTAGVRPSVDSFRRIYESFFGRPLPKVDEPVAEEFLYALENHKGVMYEAWRGKGKSTFFAAWCPTVMGWRPVGSTTLIRVNDQKAKEMGKAIADLIKTNPGWKKVFPHVVPDERAGWSVEKGFNVLDTRITGEISSADFEENYSMWRMTCFADHLSEQSLLCAGIESGSVIGLHPSNGMWFDDLLDEGNTRSVAELQKVNDLFEGNIAATWISAGGSPTLGVFCTPWAKNDVYQKMLATGRFKHIKMPVFVESADGETIPEQNSDGVPALPEWKGKKVKLTWPEVFSMDRVIDMMNTYKTRFGQMALLDIELSAPKNMRYIEFNYKEIRWDQWRMTDGVDPVGTVTGISKGDGISHFAMYHLLETPYNSVVIAGGVLEKCDTLQSEGHIAASQRTYAKTHRGTSIESNGVGAVFIAGITRNKGVRIHPHAVSEIGAGSKPERQYRFLQPLLASGALLVSDEDTPEMNAVREYCDHFPNFAKDSYLWDVGDALCAGVIDIPELWTRIVTESVEDIFDNKDAPIVARAYGLGNYQYLGR